VVQEVTESYFVARLAPSGESGPEFLVDVPLVKVDDDDRELLEPDATFYLTIGYIPIDVGRRIHTSEVRFRRLPAWRSDDVAYFSDIGRKKRSELVIDGPE